MLSNDSFDWRDVIEPHARCTMQRMSQESLVLCLQDTTELDFNGQRTDGLGPLSYEAQRDLYLLPAYAVSTQRESLCVLDAWMRALEPPDARGVRGGVTEATELIDWYRARWEVEIFFHVLKTGCRVEALQLASLPRIERALALFMVVSWRIAHLMRTGRTCPGLPASLLFGDGEPGVKTIWLGLQRVMDFAAGVRFMRESESGPSCV